MFKQILLFLILAGITVMIHAVGSVRIVAPMTGIWSRKDGIGKSAAAVLPLVRLVTGLLLLHLLKMIAWALAFTAVEMLPDLETSMYYSLMSYTTVGYGDVGPVQSWRLIGPLEAAVGVLMLGWSTGFIVVAVQRTMNNNEVASYK